MSTSQPIVVAIASTVRDPGLLYLAFFLTNNSNCRLRLPPTPSDSVLAFELFLLFRFSALTILTCISVVKNYYRLTMLVWSRKAKFNPKCNQSTNNLYYYLNRETKFSRQGYQRLTLKIIFLEGQKIWPSTVETLQITFGPYF